MTQWLAYELSAALSHPSPADSAMAGGKDTSKIDEALAAVEGIVRGMLK